MTASPVASSGAPAAPDPVASDPGSTSWGASGTLLLVGLGVAGGSEAAALPPLAAVAERLAARLGLGVQQLELRENAGPDAALALLAAAESASLGPALVPLPLDVGLPLADGRCWAETLGAWRQPCLLVVSAAQLRCGLPAAATTLLQHWQVPLLGLVQWGGSWDGEGRRRDGLPWLGLLVDPEAAAGPSADHADLRAAELPEELLLEVNLALRWRQLDRG